jgi:hypothetical protein
MDEFSTTSDNLDQTDEEILNPTVSDDAIEWEAGMDAVSGYTFKYPQCFHCSPVHHCELIFSGGSFRYLGVARLVQITG